MPAWRGRHQFGDGNLEIGPVEVDRFASPEPADYLQELVEKRSTPCEIVAESDPRPVTAQNRNEVAARIWRHRVPLTETQLAVQDLAYFTFHFVEANHPQGPTPRPPWATCSRRNGRTYDQLHHRNRRHPV